TFAAGIPRAAAGDGLGVGGGGRDRSGHRGLRGHVGTDVRRCRGGVLLLCARRPGGLPGRGGRLLLGGGGRGRLSVLGGGGRWLLGRCDRRWGGGLHLAGCRGGAGPGRAALRRRSGGAVVRGRGRGGRGRGPGTAVAGQVGRGVGLEELPPGLVDQVLVLLVLGVQLFDEPL